MSAMELIAEMDVELLGEIDVSDIVDVKFDLLLDSVSDDVE